jgi:pimeloyl-ACP methyl ester carboxylesterase
LRFCVFVGAVWCALATFFWPASAQAQTSTQLSPGIMTTLAMGSGDTVALYSESTGHGRPLLFLHGLGGSGYTFRHLVPTLARSHRVITLDLKGFGRSEKIFDRHYSIYDQARLVEAFITAHGLSGVTLVGHSYGGLVALVAALDLDRRAPGRIAQLVLMDVPALPQPLPRVQAFLNWPVLPYVALATLPPVLTARVGLRADRRRTPSPDEHDISIYAAPISDAAGRHALIASARLIAEDDGRAVIPRYARLRTPTLLLWCRDDPTVPTQTGVRLARMLPRARLAVIEGCEHVPPEEAPGETLRALLGFLRR